MRVILPKVLGSDLKGPLFFLMGPIRGGDDWQYECALELDMQMREEFSVAIPCRYGEDHPLYAHRALGEEQFSRQLPWERYYLNQAANMAPQGCIIVWLPRESKTSPRSRGDGPYAQDTYGELGEWRGRIMRGERVRLVIGAHPDFPGLDVIKRNFELALSKGILISPSIEDLVARAIETANIHVAAP